jgi:hypothetical protein
VPADGDQVPLTERLFYAFNAVSRWAGRGVNDAAGTGEGRRGCGHPLTLLKFVVFFLMLVLLPVFMLPMVLARLAQTGRTGFQYSAAVQLAQGEGARWAHGTLPPAASAAAIRTGAAAIAEHDPGFHAEALTDWSVAVTALIRQSLVSGDAAPARTVMANGLYRIHRALLELRTRAGVTCEGSWGAIDAALVAASRGALLEEVRVRVTCRGWRQERHKPTGTALRGGPDVGTWSEDLTFARSSAATTPDVGGLPAGRCPSCGAHLDLDPDGACRYCHGVVTVGRRDWVLVSWQREPW